MLNVKKIKIATFYNEISKLLEFGNQRLIGQNAGRQFNNSFSVKINN